MADNYRWTNSVSRNFLRNINFRIAGIIGVIIIAFALPITVLFLGQQQQTQQRAAGTTPSVVPFWSTSISASAACISGTGIISFSFKNTDSYIMILTVKDVQTGKSVSVGQISPGQTKTGQIDTGSASLANGTVQFLLSAPNKGTDTQTASYNAVQCHAPTPTPQPSHTPTPIPSPTKTPTPPTCQANQSVCTWDADANAVSYHYKVNDTATGIVSEGDVNAPQTSVSFPAQSGHSYVCTVSGSNACGTGSSGTGTFTCNQPTPTPTSCPVPATPPNVRISCPNCTGQ